FCGHDPCPFRAAVVFLVSFTQGGGEYALPWAVMRNPFRAKISTMYLRAYPELVWRCYFNQGATNGSGKTPDQFQICSIIFQTNHGQRSLLKNYLYWFPVMVRPMLPPQKIRLQTTGRVEIDALFYGMKPRETTLTTS
ncbi:MAG: hypothetical protein FWC50_04570, partial [Planctomycetaceae bacterium]|nr:hypothetical protein [Planctomycetaceae bacterium]